MHVPFRVHLCVHANGPTMAHLLEVYQRVVLVIHPKSVHTILTIPLHLCSACPSVCPQTAASFSRHSKTIRYRDAWLQGTSHASPQQGKVSAAGEQQSPCQHHRRSHLSRPPSITPLRALELSL